MANIYIVVEDYGYDGQNNIWAGADIVQCFDKVKTPGCVDFIESKHYDLSVQVFGLDGKLVNNVYPLMKDIVSLEAFKEALATV